MSKRNKIVIEDTEDGFKTEIAIGKASAKDVFMFIQALEETSRALKEKMGDEYMMILATLGKHNEQSN